MRGAAIFAAPRISLFPFFNEKSALKTAVCAPQKNIFQPPPFVLTLYFLGGKISCGIVVRRQTHALTGCIFYFVREL